MKTSQKILIALGILSLLILELVCARLAFYTFGEIVSASYFMFIFLNLIPLFYLIFTKYKTFALSFIFGIAILIIPHQLYLGHKLIFLKEEAANITIYLYEEKLKNGSYPKDLSSYHFTYANLEKDFGYYLEDDKYRLSYSVGTKSTSHFLYSENGKWGYYPD